MATCAANKKLQLVLCMALIVAAVAADVKPTCQVPNNANLFDIQKPFCVEGTACE
uniref:Uncharacterized protein n=1 Tax=Setaria italica TaxID=4555 RepID=K3YD89_SETIT